MHAVVDPRGPRFAAWVTTAVLVSGSAVLLGLQVLVFALVGAVGYATGFTTLGVTATAMALGAAFLNAAFGFCLGCEVYLRLPRPLRRPVPSDS